MYDMNLLQQLFHAAILNRTSWLPEPDKNAKIRNRNRSRADNPSGTKFIKAAGKHCADHSNPGGVVSEYFRAKNSKIA